MARPRMESSRFEGPAKRPGARSTAAEAAEPLPRAAAAASRAGWIAAQGLRKVPHGSRELGAASAGGATKKVAVDAAEMSGGSGAGRHGPKAPDEMTARTLRASWKWWRGVRTRTEQTTVFEEQIIS